MYNLSLSDMDKLYKILDACLRIGIKHLRVDELMMHLGCEKENIFNALDYWTEVGNFQYEEKDGIITVLSDMPEIVWCMADSSTDLVIPPVIKTTGVDETKNEVIVTNSTMV